jgi:hypothetical protein
MMTYTLREKEEDREFRIANCDFGSDKKPSISKKGDLKVIT